jgi:hypothetical protein
MHGSIVELFVERPTHRCVVGGALGKMPSERVSGVQVRTACRGVPMAHVAIALVMSQSMEVASTISPLQVPVAEGGVGWRRAEEEGRGGVRGGGGGGGSEEEEGGGVVLLLTLYARGGLLTGSLTAWHLPTHYSPMYHCTSIYHCTSTVLHHSPRKDLHASQYHFQAL